MASARELMRSGKTIFGVVFLFAFLLVLVALIHSSVNEHRDAPVIAISASGDAAQVLHDRLSEQGLRSTVVANPRLAGETTATVLLDGKGPVVTLAYPHPPAWIPLERAIEAMGYSADAIEVVRENGVRETDILRINLSTVLIAGFMAIVFFGTSVPLVAMRRRGTLRLLGTTPLTRLTFLLAQSPVRVALGCAEIAIVVAIAGSLGYLDPAAIGRLTVTLLLGLAMLFALGYLLATRARNPDLVAQLCGLIPVLIVLTSGTMFPVQGIPEWGIAVMRAVPTSWFMQAASADIAGTAPFAPVPALWLLMAIMTASATVLAARIFSWDQGEP